jgi:hypothetical protein
MMASESIHILNTSGTCGQPAFKNPLSRFRRAEQLNLEPALSYGIGSTGNAPCLTMDSHLFRVYPHITRWKSLSIEETYKHKLRAAYRTRLPYELLTARKTTGNGTAQG